MRHRSAAPNKHSHRGHLKGWDAIAVGVKHGNACGAAMGEEPAQVLRDMMAGDPQAIFGGLVMMNFEIGESLAELLVGKLLDGIVAPSFTPEAVDMLRRKKDRCRFLANQALRDLRKSLDHEPRFRYIRGGFLVQPNYDFVLDLGDPRMSKNREATPEEERDMLLAWAIGSTSNSNTITLVKDGVLIANGVGQQDRVGAAELAIKRAQHTSHTVFGSVAYSDSFFPFPDGPQTLIDAGVKAIITSSGSVRDSETITLCDERGIALYMIPDAIGRGFFGH